MKNLTHHPHMWLRDDAAASLDRFERDHGVQPLTSAGRTVQEQDALLHRFAHPRGPQDRPPALFAPAPSSGPNKSRHIDGKAVDTANPDVFHKYGEEYGFRFLFEYDKVHFEYDPAYDRKAGGSRPAPAKSKRATIRKGSRGKDVKDLQLILNKYYPAYSKLATDGIFGAGTENTVKEFQRRAKLTPDGIVGPATWAKLGQ